MEKLPLKVAFILAHPDDEAIPFGLGAQLALDGNESYLFALTKGDLGSHDMISRRRIARTRQREFKRAGELLGATEAKILGLNDGELDLQQRRARRRLLRELRKINPDVVIVHGRFDYHQDHNAAHDIGQWAAFHLKDGPIITRHGLFGRKIPPTTKDISFYEMDTQGSQTWISTQEDRGSNVDHIHSVNTVIPVSNMALLISTIAFNAHQSQLGPRTERQLSYVELAKLGIIRRGGVGLNFLPFGGYAFSTRNVLQKRSAIPTFHK